jgi:hypothetical protein
LSISELLFQDLYYVYELVRFEKRVKDEGVSSVKTEIPLIKQIPDLIQYVGGLPGAAQELDAEDSQQGSFTFLANGLKGKIHAVTFIPLTGNRTYDNYLSYATYIGFNLSTIVAAFEGPGSWVEGAFDNAINVVRSVPGLVLSAFGTVAGRTWHHHEIMGVMEMLWSSNHHGRPGLGHVGGTKFWRILHGEAYKGGPVGSDNDD